MKSIFLSVILPCFNEEQNIRMGALEKVSRYMSKKGYPWEVIIVDDGSTDESISLIKEAINEINGFRLIENEHKGKAATVIKGMLEAKGKFRLFTDLDQATPLPESEKLLDWTKKGYDVVIGSRNTHRPGAPFFRLLMARGFMFLRNLILNLGINDTQCGFKLFTDTATNRIFKRVRVFGESQKTKGSTVTAGFDVEVLFIAKKLGFKIKEVPVEWHYQETRRVSPLRDSLRGLRDLLKIRLLSIKGYYD